MDTFDVLRWSVSGLIFAFALYNFARPQKIQEKKKNWSVARVRISMGVVMLLMVIQGGLQWIDRSTSETSSSVPSDKIAKFDAIFRDRLARYPASIQDDVLTRDCQKSIIEQIRSHYSFLPQTSLDLAALAHCSCMINALNDMPETRKARELVKSGKSQSGAFDQAYRGVADFQTRIQPCIDM